MHLVSVLQIMEVLGPVDENVPEALACAQMLEIIGHVSSLTNRLRKFRGAFSLRIGFSDMVGQAAVDDPLSGGGRG